MKFSMALATGALLVFGLAGCNGKIKADLAKCTADSAKATAELNASKGELDGLKKQVADLTQKMTVVSKEREDLLVRVTECDAATKAAEEAAAAKAAPAPKKAAAKKEAPKTSTGAPVPTVEKKFKGRFAK